MTVQMVWESLLVPSLKKRLFVFCIEAHMNRNLTALLRCEADSFTTLGLEVNLSWFLNGFVCLEFDFMTLFCHLYASGSFFCLTSSIRCFVFIPIDDLF